MIRPAIPIRLALLGICAFALIEFAQVGRVATLSVRIYDATGAPTPARILLQDSRGNRPRARSAIAISESAIPIPKQALAVMWGQQDRAQGYALQPDGAFYADGAFDVSLAPGTYTLTVSKGFEYLRQTQTIDAQPGSAVTREIRLARWIDMPGRGWYSADDHIHLRRSPGDNAAIARWIAAEDIHVGNILEMGDFWATFFSQYAFGEAGRYLEAGRILSPGQEEPRTPEIGHTISLAARELVRMTREYYSFDRVFDRVHELGGLTGFAHQGMSFHGYRGMSLAVPAGKIDFLELAQFCVPEGPLATEHYYHFLDLGYRLTALAGSDFPWCGQGVAQIGNARFYTYVGGPLTFDRWLQALKAGHTFVSTGPMVTLTVNGKTPGDTVDVAPGSPVRISAEAFGDAGQVPLTSLEIFSHGKTLTRSMTGNTAHLTATFEGKAEHGMWIVAKCAAGPGQVAHTSPIYVTVNGGSFRNPETFAARLATTEKYIREIEQEMAAPGNTYDSQSARYREDLNRQIVAARAILARQ